MTRKEFEEIKERFSSRNERVKSITQDVKDTWELIVTLERGGIEEDEPQPEDYDNYLRKEYENAAMELERYFANKPILTGNPSLAILAVLVAMKLLTIEELREML